MKALIEKYRRRQLLKFARASVEICFAAVLCLCATSCVATQSVMSGGKIESRPVLYSESQAPKVSKNKDGSITLNVHYETIQKSTMGPLFKGDTTIKTEQRIFIADRSTMQPALSVIKQRFPHYDEAMLTTMFADTRRVSEHVPKRGSLKVSHGWPVNGSHMVCPSEECIIYDKDFIWFIPAKGKNSQPMAAVIPSPSNSHTPLKEVPLKAALLPVAMLSDVAINTWLVVAVVTGQDIDL